MFLLPGVNVTSDGSSDSVEGDPSSDFSGDPLVSSPFGASITTVDLVPASSAVYSSRI